MTQMTFLYGGPVTDVTKSSRPGAYPQRGVWAEIKPHTFSGIRAGIVQLAGRPNPEGRTRHLVTYRPKWGKPSTFQLLISDPTELNAALAVARQRKRGAETLGKAAAALKTWRLVREFPSPSLDQPIPLGSCPIEVGRRIEATVRENYRQWIGVVALDPKSGPSAKGVDIAHELAGFLRELAAELETY